MPQQVSNPDTSPSSICEPIKSIPERSEHAKPALAFRFELQVLSELNSYQRALP